MYFTYSMLYDVLEPGTYSAFVQNDTACLYQSVLYHNKIQSFQEHNLYIFTARQLQRLPVTDFPSDILCIGTIAENILLQLKDSTNLIVLYSHIDAPQLCSKINSAIQIYQQYIGQLLNIALNQQDINIFLNKAHELLKEPLWIVDTSNRLLAYTKDDQSEEAIWKETVRTGYVSLLGYSSYEPQMIDTELEKPDPDLQMKICVLKHPFLISKIATPDHTYGMFNISEEKRPITPGKEAMCAHIAKLLIIILQHHEQEEPAQQMARVSFLDDLLEKRLVHPYEIRKRTDSLRLVFKQYFHVMLIPYDPHIDSSVWSKIITRLSSLLYRHIFTSYHGDIVALLNHSQDTAFNEEEFQFINHFLSEYQLHACVSNSFLDLSEVFSEYIHVLETSEIARSAGSSLQTIYYYKDFFFLYLKDILREKADLNTFCAKGLIALQKYDKEKHTHFVDTLYTYLKNNMSPGLTSKELFIHRSTLNYRLKKIEDIANIDFSNSEDVFLMNFSLHLLGYRLHTISDDKV